MKILRILTRPNVGGPTRQASNLWLQQTALGHQCLTVTGVVGKDEAALNFSALGIPQIPPHEVSALSSGYLQVPTLARSIRPLRDLRAYRGLRRIIKSFEPDVVHTHTSKAGWLGRFAALREGVPVIAHTFHGHVLRDYYSAHIGWGIGQLEAWLAKRTHLLFAISQSCAEELRELGVSDACRVIHPAVETSEFAAADRKAARDRLDLPADLPADLLVLAFVGRLAKIKRVDRFARLGAAVPHAVGVIFGDGPEGDQLAGQANINRVGTKADLHLWLPGCDILVMPSEREGFPLAAVEAAAAGIPTVGFDVPGVSDIVRESGFGSLVPKSMDIPGLTAAIEELRRKPSSEADDRLQSMLQACSPCEVAKTLVQAYEARLPAG